MSTLNWRIRNQFRRFLYAEGLVGSLARSARSLVPSESFDQRYWDRHLSGEFAPYLGGTPSIDARNALVVTLLSHHARTASRLLDVGCAAGALSTALPAQYRRYMGIDISAYAIDEARKRVARPGCEFFVSDLQSFQLEEDFDVIVFNEVLYYVPFDDVLAELDRYASFLSSEGVVCISMKHDPRNEATYRRMARKWRYLSGFFYQEKTSPEHRISLNRERPAHLLSLWRPL